MMRRREFITLLGGAAAGPSLLWLRAARAQQGGSMRRVGVLNALPADDPEWQARLAAFHQGLQELGWIVGRNVRIDYRLGTADGAALRRRAAELVALAPDVIVVNGTSPMQPLLQTTRSVPIVFVQVTDPVGAGYVASLARPGGNTTGFTQFEYGMTGKWLGAAQAGRAGRETGGSAAGCLHTHGHRAARRPVLGGAIAWNSGKSARRARPG